jgi:molybdopterin molybdotransferase
MTCSAFEAIGGRIDLWKLSLKPGKPFFFGHRDDHLLLGVPGNPVSAFVTTVLLVLPALRRLQGDPNPTPPTLSGRLTEPVDNPDRRRHFVRVHRAADGSVRSAGTQASHRLLSLALANGLVDVPPKSTLPAGTSVPVILW